MVVVSRNPCFTLFKHVRPECIVVWSGDRKSGTIQYHHFYFSAILSVWLESIRSLAVVPASTTLPSATHLQLISFHFRISQHVASRKPTSKTSAVRFLKSTPSPPMAFMGSPYFPGTQPLKCRSGTLPRSLGPSASSSWPVKMELPNRWKSVHCASC